MSPFVRLEDARGCWTERKLSDLLNEFDQTADEISAKVWLSGEVWRRLPFHLVSEGVFRSPFPACGHLSEPFKASLHLPEGWHPPAGI